MFVNRSIVFALLQKFGLICVDMVTVFDIDSRSYCELRLLLGPMSLKFIFSIGDLLLRSAFVRGRDWQLVPALARRPGQRVCAALA